MSSDSKLTTVRNLDRLNLRLSAETFAEIDAARSIRPGAISRNTWITEAIEEKLRRDQDSVAALSTTGRRAHG
jgi:hypothetical protein